MRRLAALLALLALPALAEEPPTGLVKGDWKGCKYQLAVPGQWKKADGPAYSLFVTFVPPPHEVTNYGQLWMASKGPKPFLALAFDGGMSAPDGAALVEKVKADYGPDADRVFLVTYGEGAVRGLQYLEENTDTLAGWIILQPSLGDRTPKAGGRSVPILIMNDKSCSYSPSFQAEGLRRTFEGLGYEAAFVETDDPANHDGWPTKDMSRLFEWAAAVTPAKPEAVSDEAAAWLAGGKDADCRPKVRAAAKKYFALYGDAMTPPAAKTVEGMFTTPLRDALPVVKEIKGGNLKGQVALVAAAKGKKVEGGCLVICDSAEFDTIEDSLVICSGDVKANHVKGCVVIAKGAVTIAKDLGASLVHAGGHVKVGTTVEDCTFLALGGVEAAGKAKNNLFVNTADVKIKSNENAKNAKKLKLPGAK